MADLHTIQFVLFVYLMQFFFVMFVSLCKYFSTIFYRFPIFNYSRIKTFYFGMDNAEEFNQDYQQHRQINGNFLKSSNLENDEVNINLYICVHMHISGIFGIMF